VRVPNGLLRLFARADVAKVIVLSLVLASALLASLELPAMLSLLVAAIALLSAGKGASWAPIVGLA